MVASFKAATWIATIISVGSTTQRNPSCSPELMSWIPHWIVGALAVNGCVHRTSVMRGPMGKYRQSYQRDYLLLSQSEPIRLSECRAACSRTQVVPPALRHGPAGWANGSREGLRRARLAARCDLN